METVKQLSLFLENKPGHVYQICKALGDARINIHTLALADTNQFGILRVMVEDAEKAYEILTKEGFVVKVTEVLAVKIEDIPGSLAMVCKILSEADVNVEYAYAFASRHIFLYRVSDNQKAYDALVANGYAIVSQYDLFNTNK